MFIDASAMIAIIAGENDADELADTLEYQRKRLCSAISIWETLAGLCHSHGIDRANARALVQRFIDAGGFVFVAIGQRECALAADASERFGKGRHPAGLNMGDCFAYACAKANDVALLYKGYDFEKTDLARLS